MCSCYKTENIQERVLNNVHLLQQKKTGNCFKQCVYLLQQKKKQERVLNNVHLLKNRKYTGKGFEQCAFVTTEIIQERV
jgi:hypothetical protein